MVDARPELPVLRGKTLESAGFLHGFSTRLGGVSAPPFHETDFALLRDPDGLAENQRRLAAGVGFDPERLFQALQVHGRRVLEPGGDRRAVEREEADALVARAGSGDAVAVRIADCVPILIGARDTGDVAAVHAGWRGVVAEIAHATVAAMGSSPAAMIAAIGPCIGGCCFEVSAEVAEQIVAACPGDGAGVVRARYADKARVDLRAAVRIQLVAAGLADANIEDVPAPSGPESCTRCDATRYHSYRRDGDDSGRLIAVIRAR